MMLSVVSEKVLVESILMVLMNFAIITIISTSISIMVIELNLEPCL